MSATEVYQQVRRFLSEHLDREQIDPSSSRRLVSLILGILHSKSSSPARIARSIAKLGLSRARPESIERQIRRAENDPELQAKICLYPLVRQRLLLGKPRQLFLILDPTLQEDRIVMVSVAIWYRGRALPIAWAIWPANQPLTGAGMWERVAELLQQVATVLPVGIPVIWLADRAFGTPAFIDLLTQYGWHYVIRVQGQTHFRDRMGKEVSLASKARPGCRMKMRGDVFKKAGWRINSVVIYWGTRYTSPLILVSDLPPVYILLDYYRKRYPIEASFRDYKSYGWQWERSQVTDLEHIDRLLVAMALATWITLLAGAQVAREILFAHRSTRRLTRPYEAKSSLFTLGLDRIEAWFLGACKVYCPWCLSDWTAYNWEDQISFPIRRRFVFA